MSKGVDMVSNSVVEVIESEICDEPVFDSQYDDDLYNICESFESKTEIGPVPENLVKRAAEDEPSNNSKRQKCDNGDVTDATAGDEKVKCPSCQILVRKKYFATHSRSKLHKSNVSKLHNTIKVCVESACGKRVISYKMNEKSFDHFDAPEVFLNSVKNEIMVLIQKSIEKYTVLK
ncbi:unnamed protein product [Leptosia nina]|uniref:C2H2-type domain-containing protein n=1 Tax=Leptosia nina TaxID=320188 RepID=A0AAV1JCA7_9NEOP